MPVLEKPGLILHRLAGTEAATFAFAVGANYVASVLCQERNFGLPLMVPAALMNAAWAAQPDLLAAFVGEIGRQLAQIEGRMPHALDHLVVRVRQRFLAPLVDTYAYTECADKLVMMRGYGWAAGWI